MVKPPPESAPEAVADILSVVGEALARYIFRPSRTAIPSGLRKSTVTRRAGRSASRVRSYNKLSPASQTLLRRTGQRDAYLAGQTTVRDVRETVRPSAIQRGIAKATGPTARETAEHMFRLVSMRPPSIGEHGARAIDHAMIASNASRMTPRQRASVIEWDTYDQYDAEIDSPEYEDEDGDSLLWYH